MRVKNPCVICVILALSVLPPVSASLLETYSNFIQWADAAPDLSTINYSTDSIGSISGNITPSQMQFNPLFGDSPAIAPGNAPFLFVVQNPGSDAIYSLAINLATFDPDAESYTVTVDEADQTVSTETIPALTIASDGFAFYGATFDEAITGLQITSVDPGGSGGLSENLSLVPLDAGDDPSPTPEGAPLWMIGWGLVGMRWYRSILVSLGRQRSRRS